MSAENLELARTAIDAFNRRDIEAVIAVCDPEVEWLPPRELPGWQAYHGHDGARQAILDLIGVFAGLEAELEQLIDAGDRVVVLYHWRGGGATGGVSLNEFQVQVGALLTIGAGKVTRAEFWTSWADALAAAGLSAEGRDV